MLTKAPFIQARNYSPSARLNVLGVCIHTMEAPEGPKTAESVALWFANQPKHGTIVNGTKFSGTSAHWNVDADNIVQSVREQDVAWHAGPANNWSIGIEHAGYARQSQIEWLDAYSTSMLDRSATLCAEICRRWSIPVRKLTADDLRKGRREGIFGHVDVTDALTGGMGHRDPGIYFPWQYYLTMVADRLDLLIQNDGAKAGIVTATKLNIRTAPSVMTGIIATAPQGTQVTILDYEPAATSNAPKGWYKIQLPSGQIGYASAEYIAKA